MSLELFPLESITGANITGHYFTRVSSAQTGQSISRNYGGGYWKIAVDLLRKDRAEHDRIFAFLNARQGRFERFKICLPVYSQSKSHYQGDIYVNGSGQSGSAISVKGMTANTEKILCEGDYINIEGHSKVYILTRDLDSDLNGEGTLHIAPNLVAEPNDNARVIYDNVLWTVRNVSDEISLNLDLQIKAAWSLTFQEAWQ